MKKVILTIFLILFISGCSFELAEISQQQEEEINEIYEKPRIYMQNGIKVIDMTVRQWEFIPSKFNLTLGERVKLKINSEDVKHGIQIPGLNITKEITPNDPIEIDFIPQKKGEFTFRSHIYSGIGFKDMKGKIIIN